MTVVSVTATSSVLVHRAGPKQRSAGPAREVI